MHITEKQLKFITEIASEKAIEAYQEKRSTYQKERADRRLRNIKLLLRKYREFKQHCDSEVKLELQYYENRDEMLSIIEDDEHIVESIKRSKKRTLAIIEFIDQMLEVFKIMSQQSDKPEDIRRYEIVYKMYISDSRHSIDEIVTCHKIEPRTVYRDVDKACETLSALMFGIDSIKMID